jgi:general secretion pathway protein C
LETAGIWSTNVKRASPIIALLLIALLAFGSAYGLNRVIASFLVVPESALVTQSADDQAGPGAEGDLQEVRATPKGRRDYVDGILKRNIFDAEFIALYNPSPTNSETNEESERKTDLKVRLIGTVVAEPAAYSSALIADDDRNAEALGYGVGDKLYDAELTAIEARRVTLRRSDGSIEFLTMDPDEKAPARKSTTTAKATDGDDDGIQEVAEGKYIVPRETMDKYMSDLDALSRMGRALLHRGPDGEYDGYRMSAIRRNSMADKLGIKNGDIVHSVNGMALNSMSGAMNAMQTLQTEAEFGFEITRRGQKSTLSYEIR